MPREEVEASGVSVIRCNSGVTPSAQAGRRESHRNCPATRCPPPGPAPLVAGLGDDRVDPPSRTGSEPPFLPGGPGPAPHPPRESVSSQGDARLRWWPLLGTVPRTGSGRGHAAKARPRAAEGATCRAPRGPHWGSARRRRRGRWPSAPHSFPPHSRHPVTPSSGHLPSRACPSPHGQGLGRGRGGRRVRPGQRSWCPCPHRLLGLVSQGHAPPCHLVPG